MIYTVRNTVQIGKYATVIVNGVLLGLCIRAVTFGPFVAAETIRTYKDGTPIVFGGDIRTRWVFGLGHVHLVELA